jgi:hypothetical protein
VETNEKKQNRKREMMGNSVLGRRGKMVVRKTILKIEEGKSRKGSRNISTKREREKLFEKRARCLGIFSPKFK